MGREDGMGSSSQAANGHAEPETSNPSQDQQLYSLFEQRLSRMEQAHQVFNNSGGTTNIGSTLINIGAPQVSTYQVSEHDPGLSLDYDSAEQREIFVSTPAQQVAYRTLNERQVVVISGRSGSGRRTLAYKLIEDLCATNKGLEPRQLPGYRSLTALDEEDFKRIVEHRVYLIVLQGGDHITHVDLQKLVNRVQQKKSYLVLVCGDDAFIPMRGSTPVQLTGMAAPQPAAVFARHVARRLKIDQQGVSGTSLESTLDAVQTSDVLARTLRETPDLRRVTELAAHVARRLRDDASCDTLLEEVQQFSSTWLAVCASEYILEAKYSRAQLCLLISASVLTDVPVDEFWHLADRLRVLMDDQFSDEDRERWEQLKRLPSTDWLAAARCRSERVSEWYEDRQVWLDVIKGNPPALSLHIMSAFWREYQQDRSKLGLWLLSLGKDRGLSWRARIAVTFAVGVLLLHSPDWFDRVIIEEWLMDEFFLPQENGAIAIRFAAQEDTGAARQWLRRLKEWTRDKDKRPRLIFASALIYAWLSIHDPEGFIEGMDQLVAGSDAWVLTVRTRDDQMTIEGREQRQPALRIAFVRAMQLGGFKTREHYECLFKQLAAWCKSSRRDPRRLARHVTIILMTNYQLAGANWEGSTITSGDRAGERLFVPIMLEILHKYEDMINYAAMLIGQAMISLRAHRDCRAAIQELLAFATNQEAYRASLELLLVRLCEMHALSSDHQRELLREWLKAWVQRNEDQQQSRYGKEVARLLRGKGLI